jgi:putative transposase
MMPEHVHLLVAPREANVFVGKFQGEVKERTARPAIAWLELNAPSWLPRITVRERSRVRRRFWQPGGGYDRNIDHFDTLLASINYLDMNPVRRGLVERPEDWIWSSAQWYAGIRPTLIKMDATIPRQ